MSDRVQTLIDIQNANVTAYALLVKALAESNSLNIEHLETLLEDAINASDDGVDTTYLTHYLGFVKRLN